MEGLANYFGLRRRCEGGNVHVLSVRAGGSVGQRMSSEIRVPRCRPCHGKATPIMPLSARHDPGLATQNDPIVVPRKERITFTPPIQYPRVRFEKPPSQRSQSYHAYDRDDGPAKPTEAHTCENVINRYLDSFLIADGKFLSTRPNFALLSVRN